MFQIPTNIVTSYMSCLQRRGVANSHFQEYLKWLRYFLDFCEKYKVGGEEKQRLQQFMDKLVEKRQSIESRRIAYRAVAAYFGMLSSNIRTIQTKLGHSSLKTTMIYTHCVPVRTVKEARSPLDFLD